jgi:hypothetical protein
VGAAQVREVLAEELQLDNLDGDGDGKVFGLDLKTLRSGVVVKCAAWPPPPGPLPPQCAACPK